MKGDIVTEETDGKGETSYATAADGYGEGFLLKGRFRRRVSPVKGSVAWYRA